MNEPLGIAAASGTAVCWAFTALFFSAASRRIGQYHVNQIRLVIACVLLSAACAVLQVFQPVPFNQLVLLSLSGLVGLALGDAAGFSSLQILGARRASLLGALAPGFAALLMIPMLGESLNWVGVAGMVVTLAGVMWVVLERAQSGEIAGSAAVGIVMGLLGALGQAGGLIFSKAGMGMEAPSGLMNQLAGIDSSGVVPISPVLGTLVRMLAGTAVLLAWAAARRSFRRTWQALGDRRALAQTGAGALFGPFVGVTLSLAAVKHANTAVAATIMGTSPILVIPVVAVVYRQKITWRAVAGALVAVGGVTMLGLRLPIARELARLI
ncbi:MAG: DMT family transporter [Planctomycetes bacterium]|jgi:drug/metabolite transporter (DMT)-like permease|nr:DMT family transporter [Planctomycetota bacterium]MCL4728957.1 DMT family transporter [Planctomycetota bacterium]